MQYFYRISLYFCLLLSTPCFSQDALSVIQISTNQIISQVKQTNKTGDIESFHLLVEGILDETVQFSFIARRIMGRHFKEATPQQIEDFTLAFRKGFIKTYATSLLSFDDHNLTHSVVYFHQKNNHFAKVTTVIITPSGTYSIEFTLKQYDKWKIVNTTINGSNLGQIYRNQFYSYYKTHNGINGAIKHWSSSNQ